MGVGNFVRSNLQIMRNERYTEKADVYSFGVLIAEVLCRRRPFGGAQSLMMSVLSEHARTGLPDTDRAKIAAAADPKCVISVSVACCFLNPIALSRYSV